MNHWNPMFLLPPETAHTVALRALQAAGATAAGRALVRATCGIAAHDPLTLHGLQFRNRIGLAAGWDKDGLGLAGLGAMGFGHIELGTVTPRPQPGNPKPRVFRLRGDRALINRMGFPGRGAEFVAGRIDTWRARSGDAPARPILGVNLGRNKDTPNERAVDDYAALVRVFAPRADYLTINISSPNTQGLRDLQMARAVEALVVNLVATRAAVGGAAPPLWLKLAPDLGPEALQDTVEAALGGGIDGFITTNTTLARPDLKSRARNEAGGLSGQPLGALARTALRAVVAQVRGRVPVIASGGVMHAADVVERLADGAALVQVWTGMIYGGPRWPRAVVRSLIDGRF